MPEQKLIAVTGGTGAQGGGLVRAILRDPASPFRVRALTRKPDGPAARALRALGAEVAAADLDDQASLQAAFKGAHGAFCLTNFWEHFSPEKEYAQAGNMARAAKAAGVQHVVWSTLEDTRRWVPLDDDRMPTLMGKYKVPHFDAKGEANHLFTEAGVPTTLYHTSFYWDNLIHFGSGPKPGPDGTLQLTMPMGDQRMPGIGAEDIGRCAYGVFRRGHEFIGKSIAVAGEHLSGAEMAAALSTALGRKVVYNEVTPDAYRAFGFPGADDLGNMFQFYRDFAADFGRPRDPAFARTLYPGVQDFAAWLAEHGKQIPLS